MCARQGTRGVTRRLHALGTIVVLTVAGCRSVGGAVPETRTLSVALPATATTEDVRGAAAFESIVEALSRGALAVEVMPLGEACGDPAECLRALQEGALTVAATTTTELSQVFPELAVLDIPYLFESNAVVSRVFDGPFYARLRDALVHRAGLRPMALGTDGGWRTLINRRRDVRTPADVRGLTLWTTASPVEADLVAALGGTAARRPPSELASALATGAVDGATMPVAELVAARLHEDLRFATLDRHSYISVIWLINDAAYQALPTDLRQLVQAGFDEMERLGKGVAAEREAEAVRLFEAAGGTVRVLTPDERKRFLMASGGIATAYVEAHGPDWLVWLEGAIAEAEREIELTEKRRPSSPETH